MQPVNTEEAFGLVQARLADYIAERNEFFAGQIRQLKLHLVKENMWSSTVAVSQMQGLATDEFRARKDHILQTWQHVLSALDSDNRTLLLPQAAEAAAQALAAERDHLESVVTSQSVGGLPHPPGFLREVCVLATSRLLAELGFPEAKPRQAQSPASDLNKSIEVRHMPFTKSAQRMTAVGSGIVFLIVLLALAVAIPDPTPFQYTVFRIVLALAAAAFAATIPGFLEVTISGIARATGAIAVFLIVFFFSPAQMVTGGPTPSVELGPKSPTHFEALTDMPGVQARFAGTVQGGVGELTVNLSPATLSYPQASPDGGGRYIPYYRVLLAEQKDQSWAASYQSEKQPVGRALPVGGTISLEQKSIKIPVPSLNSLAGHWLVFEIGVAISEAENTPGTTYAHTSPSLF